MFFQDIIILLSYIEGRVRKLICENNSVISSTILILDQKKHVILPGYSFHFVNSCVLDIENMVEESYRQT